MNTSARAMRAIDARFAGLLALIASVPMYAAASGCGAAARPGGRSAESPGERLPQPARRAAPTQAAIVSGNPVPLDYDGDDNPVPGTPLKRDDRDGDERSSRLDRDDDFDGRRGSYFDADDKRLLRAGRQAPVAQARAIASMLHTYYRDAARDDGAAACSLVYSQLAKTLPADLSEAGPAFLYKVVGCPAIEDRLLAQNPAEAAAAAQRLRRIQVRLAGERGLAVMSFREMPPREIELRRQHTRWKLDALLDGEMP